MDVARDMTHPPSLLLACPHPVLLQSLKSLVDPEFDVVAMVDNALSMVDALQALEPALAVVEGSMPGGGRSALAYHVAVRYPDLTVVVAGREPDPIAARAAIEVGCRGYVVTSSAADDLRPALWSAHEGRIFVSASVQAALSELPEIPPSRGKRPEDEPSG